MGFLLDAERRIETPGEPDDVTDISDGLERIDVGITVGAGVEVHRVLFEGRYSRGLRNIVADPEDGQPFKHRSVEFLIGFRF